MRSPWANQATGISVPVTRSQGWWQPVNSGCGSPSTPGDLEGGDGHRVALVGDVHQPQEGRRPRRGLGHVLVGDQHDAAAVERERQRQRGVGRRDVGRAPVEPGDEARLAHVLDVEDHEAAVPVAHVEPVARADRVVAAVVAPRPGRRLPASGPLPRHPPAPDLLRPRRIVQIEDHHDVADVAVHLGGDVGVAPVEGEAVHARAAALPERDLARPARVGDVVDARGRRRPRPGADAPAEPRGSPA